MKMPSSFFISFRRKIRPSIMTVGKGLAPASHTLSETAGASPLADLSMFKALVTFHLRSTGWAC
jgi:adenosylmethionine-8-amino-7-oxononanoate aminotransferase